MEQNWDDTQRSFDCPLTDEQYSIVIFYIRNYGRTFSHDEFRARCISEAEAGRGLDTIKELAAIDADLTSDFSTLLMKSLLLERTATWLEIRSADPLDQYGRRNPFLDFPLEKWIEDAFMFMEALKALVKNCMEAVDRRILKNLQPVQEPMLESDLTSLARALRPFQAEFTSSVQDIARVLRERRGIINVRPTHKYCAALILEAIRDGLGITDSVDFMNIWISYSRSPKEDQAPTVERWFDKNNLLRNSINEAGKRGTPRFHDAKVQAETIRAALLHLRDKRSVW